MNKKALINAANLHVGGGVQVAVSFIYEMAHLADYDFSNIEIIVSTEVDRGLSILHVDTSVFESYRVINLLGVRAFFSPLNQELKKYAVVFTVFGPNYLRVQAKSEIVGFAQLWILEFDNYLSRGMGFAPRLKQKIKRALQWGVFKRANIFVVELEHVKDKLLSKKGINPSDIKIVYNTASSLYFDDSLWSSVAFQKEDADIHLGIVSRDYSHKNLSILPALAQVLLEKHGLRVRFYVTFNDIEWEARDDCFKKYVTNIGALLPNECPSFYQQMDGVVFPSLLECFSATPLEALAMGRPLFASDRDFVRDVCGDYAFYFDPLNVYVMAKVISNYFCPRVDRSRYLAEAKQYAEGFSSAKSRALKYLEIISYNCT